MGDVVYPISTEMPISLGSIASQQFSATMYPHNYSRDTTISQQIFPKKQSDTISGMMHSDDRSGFPDKGEQSTFSRELSTSRTIYPDDISAFLDKEELSTFSQELPTSTTMYPGDQDKEEPSTLPRDLSTKFMNLDEIYYTTITTTLTVSACSTSEY